MCHVCNQPENMFYDNLKDVLLDRLESEKIVKTIEDLGLLSEESISKKSTPNEKQCLLKLCNEKA